MGKSLIIIITIVLLLIMVSIFVFTRNNKIPQVGLKDCEEDSDCICSASCGCINENLKDANCEFLPVDKVCTDSGCECKDNKCIVSHQNY